NTVGVNVSSREVEETIYQLVGVSEVAVISVPDQYWIETVTAIVVLKYGECLTKTQVIALSRKNLSSFKVLKYVVFTKTLPKNPSGKVLKRTLRDEYATYDFN